VAAMRTRMSLREATTYTLALTRSLPRLRGRVREGEIRGRNVKVPPPDAHAAKLAQAA